MHLNVRSEVVKHLKERQDYYIQFVDNFKIAYDEYVEKIGSWGDDVEIQAISELYSNKIEILEETTNGYRIRKTFHEEGIENKSPIRIVYSGNHYDSVKVIKTSK